MLDEEKWRQAALEAIRDDREDILDLLLNTADKNSVESLLIHNRNRPHEFLIFNQKVYTKPIAIKFINRGVNLYDLMSKGNSIYAYLLGERLSRHRENDQEKIKINTFAFAGFLKNDLKIIPKPETVLKDLSKIISNGDDDIDLLAAVYEFPHDDSQKIENKHWYEAILQYVENRFIWDAPGFLKTFKFLHNKGIPLASIKNENEQNLLHLLFNHGYEDALHQKYYASFATDNDYFGDMIQLLVQLGVDANAKDKRGNTPIDYAKGINKFAEVSHWGKMLKGSVNKEVIFKLDIMPLPLHPSSAVVSFSGEGVLPKSTALGSAEQFTSSLTY